MEKENKETMTTTNSANKGSQIGREAVDQDASEADSTVVQKDSHDSDLSKDPKGLSTGTEVTGSEGGDKVKDNAQDGGHLGNNKGNSDKQTDDPTKSGESGKKSDSGSGKPGKPNGRSSGNHGSYQDTAIDDAFLSSCDAVFVTVRFNVYTGFNRKDWHSLRKRCQMQAESLIRTWNKSHKGTLRFSFERDYDKVDPWLSNRKLVWNLYKKGTYKFLEIIVYVNVFPLRLAVNNSQIRWIFDKIGSYSYERTDNARFLPIMDLPNVWVVEDPLLSWVHTNAITKYINIPKLFGITQCFRKLDLKPAAERMGNVIRYAAPSETEFSIGNFVTVTDTSSVGLSDFKGSYEYSNSELTISEMYATARTNVKLALGPKPGNDSAYFICVGSVHRWSTLLFEDQSSGSPADASFYWHFSGQNYKVRMQVFDLDYDFVDMKLRRSTFIKDLIKNPKDLRDMVIDAAYNEPSDDVKKVFFSASEDGVQYNSQTDVPYNTIVNLKSSVQCYKANESYTTRYDKILTNSNITLVSSDEPPVKIKPMTQKEIDAVRATMESGVADKSTPKRWFIHEYKDNAADGYKISVKFAWYVKYDEKAAAGDRYHIGAVKAGSLSLTWRNNNLGLTNLEAIDNLLNLSGWKSSDARRIRVTSSSVVYNFIDCGLTVPISNQQRYNFANLVTTNKLMFDGGKDLAYTDPDFETATEKENVPMKNDW